MRVIAPRPPSPLERALELPLLDALDCWLAAGAALVLRRLDELARVLRLLALLRVPALLRVLPLLRLLPLLPLLRELALRLLPLLRVPALLRVLPLLRLLPLLPLLRELALRLLPLLRVLPLLDPLAFSLAFWFRARPRDDACRLLPLVDLFDEPRLLERLEEPRPLVADIVHLLLFDSHAQTDVGGSRSGVALPSKLRYYHADWTNVRCLARHVARRLDEETGYLPG
jgi:hypothetical protein